jgi:hypothetical protein
MQRAFTAAAAILALAVAASSAKAATAVINFSGPGISGSVTVTYGSATDANYNGTNSNYPGTGYEVTGISGTFSDSNNGLNIVNAAITGLVPISPAPPNDPGNTTAPADFSFLNNILNPNNVLGPNNHAPPPATYYQLSYDNLYWPGGAPPIVFDWTFAGGPLDIYGLLFTVGVGGGNTDIVNLWYNGNGAPQGFEGYGVAVIDSNSNAVDYVAGSVPEPSTWAMMLIGFAGLGFAGYRRAKGKRIAAA